MVPVYISIIIVILTGGLIASHIRRKKLMKRFQPEPYGQLDKSCLMLTIPPCREIIDKALECLSDYNDLAVCRNHRYGSEILDAVRKQVTDYAKKDKCHDREPAIFHGYMLEATEKIAETSRHIITTPCGYVPISDKCEIETIRVCLDRLLESANNMLRATGNTDVLRNEINNDKDFIAHSIAVHSKAMTHEDFEDRSPSYSYLMLLYYLHSFVSSFSQIIKKIEINNNKCMTA